MPIYEYECENCGANFELYLTFKESDKPVKCPTCGSDKVARVISVFSTTGSSGGSCWPASGTPRGSG